MTKITRREFLKYLSIGIGAVATNELIAACGRQAESQPLTPKVEEKPDETNSQGFSSDPAPGDAEIESSPTGTASGILAPDLVVARNGEPEQLVQQALAALGGMERFVPKGARVIIKPNICVAYHSYEYAATTNPWVVGALVKLCYAAGATSVQVMDNPFGGSPEEAYARSGIAEQVQAAGGEMLIMPRFKYVTTDIPQGRDLNKVDIFEDVLNADVLIDVPIAKDHGLARLTLGMKNLMGVIRDRPAMHRNLGQRLADLTSRIMPTLTVIDAVRLLMNHGPTGGDLADVKKIDTVIASPDIVAADSYAATLFGLSPNDLSYVKAGTSMGLGRSNLQELRIEEITVGA